VLKALVSDCLVLLLLRVRHETRLGDSMVIVDAFLPSFSLRWVEFEHVVFILGFYPLFLAAPQCFGPKREVNRSHFVYNILL